MEGVHISSRLMRLMVIFPVWKAFVESSIGDLKWIKPNLYKIIDISDKKKKCKLDVYPFFFFFAVHQNFLLVGQKQRI